MSYIFYKKGCIPDCRKRIRVQEQYWLTLLISPEGFNFNNRGCNPRKKNGNSKPERLEQLTIKE